VGSRSDARRVARQLRSRLVRRRPFGQQAAPTLVHVSGNRSQHIGCVERPALEAFDNDPVHLPFVGVHQYGATSAADVVDCAGVGVEDGRRLRVRTSRRLGYEAQAHSLARTVAHTEAPMQELLGRRGVIAPSASNYGLFRSR
jgi:hypothetical protein